MGVPRTDFFSPKTGRSSRDSWDSSISIYGKGYPLTKEILVRGTPLTQLTSPKLVFHWSPSAQQALIG